MSWIWTLWKLLSGTSYKKLRRRKLKVLSCPVRAFTMPRLKWMCWVRCPVRAFIMPRLRRACWIQIPVFIQSSGIYTRVGIDTHTHTHIWIVSFLINFKLIKLVVGIINVEHFSTFWGCSGTNTKLQEIEFNCIRSKLQENAVKLIKEKITSSVK